MSQSKSGSRYAQEGGRAPHRRSTRLSALRSDLDSRSPKLRRTDLSRLRGASATALAPLATRPATADSQGPSDSRTRRLAGLGGQNEKGRLKRILGIVLVADDRATDFASLPDHDARRAPQTRAQPFRLPDRRTWRAVRCPTARQNSRLRRERGSAQLSSGFRDDFIVASSIFRTRDIYHASRRLDGSTFFCRHEVLRGA